MVSDNATEEFKRISEFMRTYLLLRLYRLTLLLGTSGAVVTALASDNIRRRGEVVILLLKLGALAISTAFRVMDFSAGGHWIRLRDRANELAAPTGLPTFSQSIPLEPIYGKRRWQLPPRFCRSPVVA